MVPKDIRPQQDLTLVIHRKDGTRKEVTRAVPHRHADRGRLLQRRRHPAVRAAGSDGGLTTHAGHHHPLAHALPLFLAAGLLLTSLDTTAKYLVRDHSVLLVVWARYAGQMLVVTPFARHRAGTDFWRTRHLRVQLVRSACLLVATGCFFSGLRYLPLAEGSAITFLAPIFIVVLAQPLLGERPTRSRWIAVGDGLRGHPGAAAARLRRVPSRRVLLIGRGAVQRAVPAPHAQVHRRQRPHDLVLQRAAWARSA